MAKLWQGQKNVNTKSCVINFVIPDVQIGFAQWVTNVHLTLTSSYKIQIQHCLKLEPKVDQ